MSSKNLKRRITEHRVDAGFTAKLYFSAYERLTDENNKKNRVRTLLSLLSSTLGLLLLSGILAYLISDDKQLYIEISLGFSVLSFLLNIYLNRLPTIKDPFDYQQRAEGFNLFHKQLKTLEARIKDGCIEKDCSILKYVEDIEEKVKILYLQPLPTQEADYQKASEKISSGQLDYTEDDVENTK